VCASSSASEEQGLAHQHKFDTLRLQDIGFITDRSINLRGKHRERNQEQTEAASHAEELAPPGSPGNVIDIKTAAGTPLSSVLPARFFT
jgi:hypothetical protein